MKRYWLFYYNDDYPIGGMDDFEGSFDTLEEAIERSKEKVANITGSCYHVFDSQTYEIVAEGKY